MKLLHLANHRSTNVGNGALIRGAERVLGEDLGDRVTFVADAWDDYTLRGLRHFDRSFVDLVNDQTDGLLVGGAVTFNGRPQFAGAGMRVDLPVELWSQIDKPVVFYGVSYRVWPGQPYHHVDQLRKTVAHLASSDRVLFGVRNDGTKAWLESLLGWESDGIVAIPDPGLYVPASDVRRLELDPSRPNLILSLNNEDEADRFGGLDSERKRAFLRNLAGALERLVKEWDLHVVVCPHYLDDYKIMAEFVSVCAPWLAHQVMVSAGLAKVTQTEYFYALYAQADVALSMRVHSMSPAIGLGTPCVPLVSQARMADFLADAGLSDLAVDVFDPDLADKVVALAGRCLGDREAVRQRLATARAVMRERTARYDRRIASLLGG